MDEGPERHADGEFFRGSFDFLKLYAKEPITVKTHSGELQVHYLAYGDSSRPTIILIHGLGSRAGQFVELANIMGKLANYGYYVVAPDLPGHGRTESPTDNRDYHILSLSRVVEDFVSKLMNKISSPGCIVLGHSLGAGATLVWLLRMAREKRTCEKLKGVIAVSLPTIASPTLLAVGKIMVPISLISPKFLCKFRSLLRIGVSAYIAKVTNDPRLRKKLLDLYLPEDAKSMEAKLRFLNENVGALADPEIALHLDSGRKSKLPLVLINGGDDALFPARPIQEYVRKILPDATFLIYEGVGHDVVDEMPDELVSKICEFASKVFD